MTYGDGDGTSYGPLISLDVAGHEMSHGVTENSAGLTYSGESGGLNESTSDIFGTLVEFYANNANDPGDYLIGEEFDLKNHSGFRRMDNPISDGSSPNCYSTDTRTRSTCTTRRGWATTSSTCWPRARARRRSTASRTARRPATARRSPASAATPPQKIWYRALTVYMTSCTNYAGARTASLNAARDLYGAGSTQYNAVAAAWSAVNVS